MSPKDALILKLQALKEFHASQADHFAPFGANNALTLFHNQAAVDLTRAITLLGYLNLVEIP